MILLFFNTWKKLIEPHISSFNIIELNKSIQGIADLTFFDVNTINLLLQRAKVLTSTNKASDQSKLLLSFYFSMISLNNFSDSNNEPLKNSIDSFVQATMSRLDIDSLTELSSIHQILRIHASEIFTLKPEQFKRLNEFDMKHSVFRSSHTHLKVVNYIERSTVFKVSSEVRTDFGTNVDIVVERDKNNPNTKVYIELDGPEHYFCHHQPSSENSRFNGATSFRNAIYAKHSIELRIFSYFIIDDRSFAPHILRILNTYPEGYLPQTENFAFNKQRTIETTSSSTKTSTSNKKKKNLKTILDSKKSEEDDFDSILNSFKSLDSSPSKPNTYETLSKNGKIKPKALIENALRNTNLKELDLILSYHNKQSPLDAEWFKKLNISGILVKYCLQAINSNRTQSKIYIQMYNLFLKYNYQEENPTEITLKALMYAFYYGNVEMFENILAIFPDNQNKLHFMEYLFINCWRHDNTDIAKILLLKNVDINTSHTRESIDVVSALIGGTLYSGKNLSNEESIITSLYDLLTSSSCSSQIANKIEFFLQKTAGGTIEENYIGKGVTALHMSVYSNTLQPFTPFLLRNGASPNTVNGSNMTPLLTALSSGLDMTSLISARYSKTIARELSFFSNAKIHFLKIISQNFF